MRAGKHSPTEPVVLARYSFLKVGALVLGTLAVSATILRDGFENAWSPPPGSVHPRVYLMGYGAAPFAIVIALALLTRLVLSRGVAIAREQSDLVLDLPWRRKRIPLKGVTVLAETKTIEAPQLSGWLKTPPAVAKQVTFARSGFPDIPFRTGLLTESADVIARRISDEMRQRHE